MLIVKVIELCKLTIAITISAFIIFSCQSRKINRLPIKKDELNYIPYYNKVNIANNHFNNKDYSKAFALYDSLFKVYSPLNRILKYEYEEYLQSAYFSKNFQVLDSGVRKLIEDFGYTINMFENDSLST